MTRLTTTRTQPVIQNIYPSLEAIQILSGYMDFWRDTFIRLMSEKMSPTLSKYETFAIFIIEW